MNISIYTLTSPLHDPITTERTANEFLKQVEAHCDCKFVNHGSDFSTYGEGDLDLVYVVTGGTEGLFLEQLPNMYGRKINILTSGKSNSLAASMEILSYLKDNGLSGEIIHGEIEYIARRIELLAKVNKGRKALDGCRLGVIGDPSDWLISSTPDEDILMEKLGIELVHISIDELIDGTLKVAPEDYQNPEKEFEARTKGAEYIYGTLCEIIRSYDLNGLTLRCFDLLEPLHNTGCLALAKLNGQGIPAGCEGDVPTLVTMAVGNALIGQSGFQANPSRINPQTGEYLFAHCTAPLNMVTEWKPSTHFESGLGIAIKGELPLGKATVFKISWDLKRSFVAAGELVANLSEPNLCRTQIMVQLQDCGDYFLTNPIGNHHVVFCGDHAAVLKEFIASL